MFDVAPTELLLVAVVALVVIGPKDLPRAMRFVGQWIGRARGVARQFRSGIDEMIRQSELDEMEKKWAAENARIMREHPPETPMIAHDATENGAVDNGAIQEMVPLGGPPTRVEPIEPDAADGAPPSPEAAPVVKS